MIERDQGRIKQFSRFVLEESLHFEQRCLRYQRQNFDLEQEIWDGYNPWARSLVEHAHRHENSDRIQFFEGLADILYEYYEQAHIEKEALDTGDEFRTALRKTALKTRKIRITILLWMVVDGIIMARQRRSGIQKRKGVIYVSSDRARYCTAMTRQARCG